MDPNSAIRNIFKQALLHGKHFSNQGKQKTPGALRPPGVISANPIPFKMRRLAVMANSIACLNFVLSVSPDFPARNRATRGSVPPRLKMKAVANFSADLTRVVPVCAAESIGVVQQVASVRDVLGGESHCQAFAGGFGERERNFAVIGQMSWSIAVQETRAV